MFYATPAQMKTIEAFSDSHGVSYKELMENAGAAAAEFICRLAAVNDLSDGILLICGQAPTAVRALLPHVILLISV